MIIWLDSGAVNEAIGMVRQKHFGQLCLCAAVNEAQRKSEHFKTDNGVEADRVDLRLGSLEGAIFLFANQWTMRACRLSHAHIAPRVLSSTTYGR